MTTEVIGPETGKKRGCPGSWQLMVGMLSQGLSGLICRPSRAVEFKGGKERSRRSCQRGICPFWPFFVEVQCGCSTLILLAAHSFFDVSYGAFILYDMSD